MDLGNSLFNARKKSGLSQEDVAEKLGVSRQTISKWELGETLPDIRQSKKLSNLYHLSLAECSVSCLPYPPFPFHKGLGLSQGSAPTGVSL